MSWTDERVEQLRKLWLDGHSASQIAGTLGDGVTRNAVIGKVHRLGLSGRVKPPIATQARPRAKAPVAKPPAPGRAPMTHGNLALAPRVEMMVAPAPRHCEDVVIPFSERVTIMDLRESMCRWPMGDPSHVDFRFCGSRAPGAVPYCAHHSGVAYQQPSQERRRDRKLVRIA